ncbi:hypothetical protein [Sphingobium nicotianae]|uniref:Lipoprotein n=1 Tax=Sphingobium nicotianae TaxID=2782607 RepID=A0A9X1IRQ6_9SPHN|nr:hypothetical protein [Sphingobium nicotianae]MBT2187678.1 hypothetical protein [Sphingobium nicotianae]
MFSRIFNILAPASGLLLAGCQQQSLSPGDAANAMDAAAATRSPVQQVKDWVEGGSDPRARIYCGRGSDGPVAQDCRMEIVADGKGRTLILSRPDGGFRRVRIGADGKLATADGAVEARVAATDKAIGVVVGEERYSVPKAALRAAAPR